MNDAKVSEVNGMECVPCEMVMAECKNDKAKQFSKFLHTNTLNAHTVYQVDESIETKLKMPTRKLN